MKFSLRDLFWLIAVIALFCGWWMQQGRVAEARRGEQEAQQAAQDEKRIAEHYQKVIDAYRRDTPYHDVRRADGSVYVTSEEPPTAGFGPAGN